MIACSRILPKKCNSMTTEATYCRELSLLINIKMFTLCDYIHVLWYGPPKNKPGFQRAIDQQG